MTELDEFWIPLVDEPIGTIVREIQRDDPEIARLAGTPHRILAFRTFAYIRVGILFGRLFVERDLEPDPDGGTWIEQLYREPECRARVVEEVRAVAREVAADPRYVEDEPLEPDEGVRERFREFARRRLSAS